MIIILRRRVPLRLRTNNLLVCFAWVIIPILSMVLNWLLGVRGICCLVGIVKNIKHGARRGRGEVALV